jgi:predicted glycosyltransferase
MKVLFAVNHPSQFYVTKNIAKCLIEDHNCEVLFVIKDKDILVDLFEAEGLSYKLAAKKHKRKSKISIVIRNLLELLQQDVSVYKIAKDWKPNIMVGTDIAITHIGKLFKIPSIVLNEDDYDVNKLFCKFSYPYATYIASPTVCSVGKYDHKKIAYKGYQKLCYLHPNRFQVDNKIVTKYIKEEKYFLLRLVSLTAGHDIEGNHSGLSMEQIDYLLELLGKHGKVYITAENPLGEKYDQYKLNINPLSIHHVLANAQMLISDSQSMSVEAAILGTPSIRFNSFVGQISVLQELEDKFGLTYGIHVSDSDALIRKVEELLGNNNLKPVMEKKRNEMLKEKIDVAVFISNIIVDKAN